MFETYKDSIIEKYASYMEALLLVGSLSRGEALPNSDVEFLAVMKQDAFNRIDSRSDKPKDRMISLGFTTKEHLKRFKPYIFTIETKKFGKVLWGDREVLRHIPDYSYGDIDPIDGFILLNNRIVEQLILLKKIEDGKSINRYDFYKGYVQLVNSYLAVNKKYKSLYPEKIAEFLRIYNGNNTDFVAKVKEAFDSLGKPQQAITSKEEAVARWKELRKYFREVWEYEKGLLHPFGARNDMFKRWLGLIKKVPRFLIYRAAVTEYFSEDINLDRAKKIIKQWEVFVK